jgi:glycosyltransferase involved in cell wall biosynthesis
MAKQAHSEWMEKADTPQDIQYILSLDTTDNTVNDYNELFKDSNIKTLIYPNRSIVDAVNNGAKHAKGDIFVVVSDDFSCPESWDILIKERLDTSKPELLHAYDTITNEVCTLPIITKVFYDTFGFIYHPHYFSMFADNDITECAKIIGGYVEAFDLVFPHNHYVNGKNKRDKTYDRENSKIAWEQGKRTYQGRKSRNFDINQ